MSGEAHWLDLAVTLLGAAAIFVLLTLVTWHRRQHAKRLRFVCPSRGEQVYCTMLHDELQGRWTEVRSCSAFADPRKVTCDQECRRLLNLGRRLDPGTPPRLTAKALHP